MTDSSTLSSDNEPIPLPEASKDQIQILCSDRQVQCYGEHDRPIQQINDDFSTLGDYALHTLLPKSNTIEKVFIENKSLLPVLLNSMSEVARYIEPLLDTGIVNDEKTQVVLLSNGWLQVVTQADGIYADEPALFVYLTQSPFWLLDDDEAITLTQH